MHRCSTDASTPLPFDPTFQQAVELVGERWTGVLVRALGISERVLSERVARTGGRGPALSHGAGGATGFRVYALTDFGLRLGPSFAAISDWCDEWQAYKRQAAG